MKTVSRKLSENGYGKHTPAVGECGRAPKYLHLEIDFRGNPRWIYREGKGQRTPMRNEDGKWLVPGSAAFQDLYSRCRYGKAAPAAISAVVATAPLAPGMLLHSNPASLAWLAEQYLLKAPFAKEATRKQHRTVLDRIVKGNGGVPYAKLTRKHVVEMRDTVAKGLHEGGDGTPCVPMANRFVSILRSVFAWAIDPDQGGHLLEDNPCDGIKNLSHKGETSHVWTDDEIEAFEAHWPLGSRERLAYALMVYTGQASCDVVRMGKQHVRKGKLVNFQRLKTGKPVNVEFAPELIEAIAAAEQAGVTGDLTFVVQANGKPYKGAGPFGNWFRDACDEAGVPDCTCHGLRHVASARVLKACAKRGENAAGVLMGVFGYTLGVAERYVRTANLQSATDGRGHFLSKAA